MRSAVGTHGIELERMRSEWAAAFEIADDQYRERLAALGASNLAEAATEKQGIDQKLTRIETEVIPEIEQLRKDIHSLEASRVQWLDQLRTARGSILQSRTTFIRSLNSSLGGQVVVELSGCDISFYFDAVDGPLQGSRMQHREDQITLACESFSPEELVRILRTESIDELIGVGITQNNANRIVNSLSDELLYRIERVDVPPLPNIRIKREGQSSYTDLSSLSVGEKCSAILSIALLSKGKPLVIDQPEDDLDHAFIIDSIVEGIRAAKQDRQIIAATHNPNIPVLGDAEMVFRVARNSGEDVCRIQNSGGLELPRVTAEVQSLEGGPGAFERRRLRYSGVVTALK